MIPAVHVFPAFHVIPVPPCPVAPLLGRYADWTEEEYYGVMMPDAWRRKQGLTNLKQARREQVWGSLGEGEV